MAVVSPYAFEEVVGGAPASAVAEIPTFTMEQLRQFATTHDTKQPWQRHNQVLKYFRHIGEVCSYFGSSDMPCWLNLPDRAR